MIVQVKNFTSNDLLTPEQLTPMAAGYDIRANCKEAIVIKAGSPAVLIPTGLAMFINDGSVAGLVLPRSGLAHKQGLVLGNTLGLIDGDYQNEWFISTWNRGQQDEIVINPGERIAQAIFIPVIHPEFVLVDEFSESTDRGMGGFGHTGV
jgi:dUTP pyrophosphatase